MRKLAIRFSASFIFFEVLSTFPMRGPTIWWYMWQPIASVPTVSLGCAAGEPFSYRYVVDGHEYRSSLGVCSQAQIAGQPRTIYYLNSAPSISWPDDPLAYVIGMSISVCIASMLFSCSQWWQRPINVLPNRRDVQRNPSRLRRARAGSAVRR
jgi:hypothetical protein